MSAHQNLARFTLVLCTALVSASGVLAADPDSTYRFEAREAKIIGVWPDVWTVERMSQLRTRYGFNFIAVPGVQTQYDAAIQAGYTPQQMLVLFTYGGGPAAVDAFAAAMYYVDEAVEHTCAGAPTAGPIHSPQELAALRDYIHHHRADALFVSSGYKRCSHLRILGEFVDRIMYSSYVHWAELTTTYCTPRLGWGDSSEVAFIPIGYDQSPSWSAMRTLFGPKFTMTWIRGREDEYDLLLPQANSLGLNGLWLYHGEPIDTTLLLNFCTAAWRNGWMIRIADTPLSHLSSLSAERVGGSSVRLVWATQGELDHRGYVVERRAETAVEFSTVPNSFVPRRGTPGTPQHYTFVDSSAPEGALLYRLRLVAHDSTIHLSLPVPATSASEVDEEQPFTFELFQNYPNPFSARGGSGSATGGSGSSARPSTTISFSLPVRSFVTLKVFDAVGREVATLVSEELAAGIYARQWHAESLASGIYFYRLQAGTFVETKKLILLR